MQKRRLRKKLRLGEFQEIGFDIAWRFPANVAEEAIDPFVQRFLNEAIQVRHMAFTGGGHKRWEGLVCTAQPGQCTLEDQATIRNWLTEQHMEEVTTSPLFDLWYGTPLC